MIQTYPDLAKMALKVLILLATTYKCKVSFSTLLHIKSKYQNRLNVTHDMRVALSKTQPKIDELITKNQVHSSKLCQILLFFLNVFCYDLLVFCFGTKAAYQPKNYKGSVMGIFKKTLGATGLYSLSERQEIKKNLFFIF